MLRVDGNQIKTMKEDFDAWTNLDNFRSTKTLVTVEHQAIKRCPEELTLLTYKQISQNFQYYSCLLYTSDAADE